MSRNQRPRRYVSGWVIALLRPFMRYSPGRGAYVLRVVGDSRGPVLREDRRRHRQVEFGGPDRRGALVSADRHQPLTG